MARTSTPRPSESSGGTAHHEWTTDEGEVVSVNARFTRIRIEGAELVVLRVKCKICKGQLIDFGRHFKEIDRNQVIVPDGRKPSRYGEALPIPFPLGPDGPTVSYDGPSKYHLNCDRCGTDPQWTRAHIVDQVDLVWTEAQAGPAKHLRHAVRNVWV